MFEFDKYERSLRKDVDAAPAVPYQPVTDIAGMSVLYWGEHCVECAAPVCYSSCDLYRPRPDRRCRRFTFGVYKNLAFPSIHGYGVEVSFKKWAKIEAFGNTAIYPIEAVLRLERLIEHGSVLSNAIGKVVNRVTGSHNWAQLTYIAVEKLVRALHRRGTKGPQPDVFLLEVYNPMQRDVRLQVIFDVSRDDVTRNGHSIPLIPPVVNTVSLPPGYSQHEFQARSFQQIVSRGLPFKITMVPEADDNARLVFLTADLVKFKRKRATSQQVKQIKCVVWDLDNTLWDGILVEGDQVTLRAGICDLLKYFDKRGILLSVVSKNDYQTAWEKLTELGVANYFLYPQIDWLPKSQKIKTIAKRLNIGLDAFAFIDDNPFELDEVSRAIPEIACIPAEDLPKLTSDPRFQGSVTEESRQRRHFYQNQISREQEQEKFGDDYLAFLQTCGIILEIWGYDDGDAERVAELVQRTNQLNFSGRKYSRGELEEVIADLHLKKYVLRCADKYGSYGTVGFCLVRHQADRIQVLDFMLSCRVQGKFIEQALFSHLVEHHNPQGVQSLWVNFHQTERNKPAQSVLESLGFRRCIAADDGIDQGMVLHASKPMRCDFIEIRCSAAASAFPSAETNATVDGCLDSSLGWAPAARPSGGSR